MSTKNRMQPVRSTAIKRIGYNSKTRLLLVELVESGIDGYMDVEESTYHEFRNAVSKGRFFATRIKMRYKKLTIKNGSELATYLGKNGMPVDDSNATTQSLIAAIKRHPKAVVF